MNIDMKDKRILIGGGFLFIVLSAFLIYKIKGSSSSGNNSSNTASNNNLKDTAKNNSEDVTLNAPEQAQSETSESENGLSDVPSVASSESIVESVDDKANKVNDEEKQKLFSISFIAKNKHEMKKKLDKINAKILADDSSEISTLKNNANFIDMIYKEVLTINQNLLDILQEDDAEKKIEKYNEFCISAKKYDFTNKIPEKEKRSAFLNFVDDFKRIEQNVKSNADEFTSKSKEERKVPIINDKHFICDFVAAAVGIKKLYEKIADKAESENKVDKADKAESENKVLSTNE